MGCDFPCDILTPLPWLLYTLCAVTEVTIDIVAESFYPAVKAFFVRPKPSTERGLYIKAVISMFFVGTMIFFYAWMPWPYADAVSNHSIRAHSSQTIRGTTVTRRTEKGI
jgi:hypothetical protein